jgi:hypothetical protein
MMTSQTLGNYRERSSKCEYLTLAFSPTNAPLRSRWRNNGLSADFLGDYVTTFLPARSGVAAAENRQNEIKHAVTYIANELLENAMKYHERNVDIPIGIHLELTTDYIAVTVSNGIGASQAERYRAFVQELLEGDPGDLLLRQQEESVTGSESDKSCLGLLTMISDHDAQLGWRFEVDPLHSEILAVTTSAILPIANAPGASA